MYNALIDDSDRWTDKLANLWTLDKTACTCKVQHPILSLRRPCVRKKLYRERSHALKAWLWFFFCAFAFCCTPTTCIKKEDSLSASFCARARAVPTTQKNCRLYESAELNEKPNGFNVSTYATDLRDADSRRRTEVWGGSQLFEPWFELGFKSKQFWKASLHLTEYNNNETEE